MKRLLYILALFFMWLPVFIVQKPAFMLYHLELGDGVTTIEWFKVMYHGLKLDLTVAGYLTALPLFCVLLSFWLPGRWLSKILYGYYFTVSILVAIIFAADLGLYGFWGFRIDSTVLFYLQSSVKDAMASVPIREALYLTGIAIIYFYVIYWLFSRLIISWTPTERANKRVVGSSVMIVLGGLMFIAIRGGVTTSTANVGMVYFSQNQFLNHAAINPSFSLLTSLTKQQDFASQFDFYPEEERSATFSTLVPSSTQETSPRVEKLLKTDRPNILIILLESFSANAIETTGGDRGITPQLNALSREGILFTQMYANSFRTDRGIVATLNGYLAQPTTSIMKYPAKSQTLPSIAKAVVHEGYVADMLYGGDINFTNMQSYFYSSGYSRITSDKDFPLTSRLSKWGANDDITFSWLYDDLSKRQPTDTTRWLTTFLTLSSHEPFEVPFHHLEDPYLNSVAFTDSCLGSFIAKTKTLPIWDDLLIILVSDHGFKYPASTREFDPNRYHIPMLWLGGAIEEPRVIDTYANQTDLAATLLSQMQLPYSDFTFSKDILNPDHPHYAFYTFKNGFGMIDGSGTTVYDNDAASVLLSHPAEGEAQRLQNGKTLLQTLYDDLGKR